MSWRVIAVFLALAAILAAALTLWQSEPPADLAGVTAPAPAPPAPLPPPATAPVVVPAPAVTAPARPPVALPIASAPSGGRDGASDAPRGKRPRFYSVRTGGARDILRQLKPEGGR